MANPYFCYAVSFAAALLTYLLGWSDLYPPLSLTLLSFILATIIIHVFLGIRFSGQKIIIFKKIQTENYFAPLFITIFLYVLWCSEFLYEGGVPLIKILLKQPYNYKVFGIPSLHVLIVTFSSFYTIYLFHIYLSKRSFFILILYGINLLAALLIYNRGMLFFNLSASTFLFLMYKKTLLIKHVAGAAIAMVILFFFFGILGSLRVSNESRKPYSNEEFLKTGRASVSFRNSIIPSEFFWSYIYTTSPLANLQSNINNYQPQPIRVSRVLEWVNNEILFDFISKRINSYTGKEREAESTIPGPFNASTVYSRSFSYLGWPGLALMGTLILAIPMIFLKILPPSSPFFLTALAILNTIFLYMVFDNTIRFTGLSFQMIYPVLLHAAIGRSYWLKRIFL